MLAGTDSVKYPHEHTDSMADMAKYQCNVCGYVYDPEAGDPTQSISPGTSFENLPEDWTCPECGAGKDEFTKL